MTGRQARRLAWAVWCALWAVVWAAAAGMAIPHQVCSMQNILIVNGSAGACMQYGTAGSWVAVGAFTLAATASAGLSLVRLTG